MTTSSPVTRPHPQMNDQEYIAWLRSLRAGSIVATADLFPQGPNGHVRYELAQVVEIDLASLEFLVQDKTGEGSLDRYRPDGTWANSEDPENFSSWLEPADSSHVESGIRAMGSASLLGKLYGMDENQMMSILSLALMSDDPRDVQMVHTALDSIVKCQSSMGPLTAKFR